jgi:hypothetical protein
MKESRVPFLESGLRRSLSTVCRGLDLGQVQEVWEENCILYFNCRMVSCWKKVRNYK